MSLIAGSYEKYIWGFNLNALKSSPQALTLTQLFSYPSHLSPIRTVAAGGPIAASAAADDTLKLYHLPSASEIATLNPESSVTALSFFTPATLSLPLNLLAGSDDGHVAIFDADPFVLLKSIPVHKKAVNDLAIHSSGKLALSVGRDSCLAMCNLIRGRRSFYCRLDSEATIVKFGLEGDKFCMVSGEKVSVHESEDARLIFEMESEKRILCATPGSVSFFIFLSRSRLL